MSLLNQLIALLRLRNRLEILLLFGRLIQICYTDAVSLFHARGVVLNTNGKSFIITYGKEASLIEIDIDTLLPIKKSIVKNTFISGSHLYNIARERILLKLN